MNKISVPMPLIAVWKLIAKIDDYWLVPIFVKIIRQKKYNIFLLNKGETINPGEGELVSHEPLENLIGSVNTGVFACLHKDRFDPEFINSGFRFQPTRTILNLYATPMGGTIVDLLWPNGIWVIADDDQTGLLPPFFSVAEIFKEEP